MASISPNDGAGKRVVAVVAAAVVVAAVLGAVAVVIAVGMAAIAYLLGRRSGRRKSAIIDIRRL